MIFRFFGIFIFCASFAFTSVNAASNLRVGPLHALLGIIYAEADFEVAESWTLGPSVSYLNRSIDAYDAEAYSVGIRGNYYFDRSVFSQGWYLGPSVNYTHVSLIEEDTIAGDLEGNASGLAFTLIGGYQWMWESFNINLGAGPVYYMLGDVEVESSDGSVKEEFNGYDGLDLGIEFTFGWKF